MDRGDVTGPRAIRVLLVDDHPAIRQGLALLLADEGFAVCGEAGSRVEALAGLEENRADAAIVDLSLDGEDGVALIADLYGLGVPVLVYSMHNDARRVESAFAAGALGYVTKREFQGVLVQALRDVAAGRRFVSSCAAAALAEGLAGGAAEAVDTLSRNERKVYGLLGHGADTFDIAAALHISNHTVESYYSRILVKLDLPGMHALRRHAIAHLQKHTT
jgi:two-component system, NarL family, invasion response regulator UvrY